MTNCGAYYTTSAESLSSLSEQVGLPIAVRILEYQFLLKTPTLPSSTSPRPPSFHTLLTTCPPFSPAPFPSPPPTPTPLVHPEPRHYSPLFPSQHLPRGLPASSPAFAPASGHGGAARGRHPRAPGTPKTNQTCSSLSRGALERGTAVQATHPPPDSPPPQPPPLCPRPPFPGRTQPTVTRPMRLVAYCLPSGTFSRRGSRTLLFMDRSGQTADARPSKV